MHTNYFGPIKVMIFREGYQTNLSTSVILNAPQPCHVIKVFGGKKAVKLGESCSYVLYYRTHCKCQ